MSNSNNLKDIYEVKYEIISPTHIGCGDNLPKTELAYFPGTQSIKKVDFNAFFSSLPSHRISEVSEFIRGAKNEYLNEILHGENLDSGDFTAEYDLQFYDNYSPRDIQDIREIHSFLKNPFLKPYIPGTTLKGWFRTAILFYWLARIREAKQYIKDVNEKLDHLPRGGWNFYKEKLKMGNIIEGKLFGQDPREDIFKYVTYSDTQPIENDCLRLALVKVFHPSRTQGSWTYKSLGFPIYHEVLNEETTFRGNIRFTTDLDRYKNHYLKSQQLHHKLRKYIIEHFFELSKKERFEKLCEMSNYFSKKIFEYNREYLMRLSDATGSSHIKRIANFYNDTLIPTYDKVAASKTQCLMRIGAGTEWHSKTIGLHIMNYFKDKLGYDFERFYNRINRLKLFKGGGKHKHFNLTPISRAYVVDRMSSPLSPLGWIKLTLVDSEAI